MITKCILTLTMTFFAATPPAFAATSATTEGKSTITPIPSTTTSINPSAQAGKSSQSSGAAMNMAAAAMMMAACMASTPPNMALCMMGAMAAMQGAADKDAADQSGTTQAATDTSGASGTNPAGTAAVVNPNGAAGTATFDQQSKINAGLATLKDAGYTATPAGISSASGNVPASAFSSSGSMLAAGLDPAAVKEAEKIGKEVASKYTTMSMAADAGGGSGGGGDAGGGDSSSSSSSLDPNAMKNPFALGQAKKAEMMAGKTVQFDGEPIGVRGDDIFQMIHAAYDKKRAGAHFIETEHDPQLNVTTVRMPASVVRPTSVNAPPTLQRLALPKR